MPHKNARLLELLRALDLGNSIAEEDALLESARVETSAFSDLFEDKVDLIPGTKGSGKSALFRIFTAFLPKALLNRRKIVIAHGVDKQGDSVFHAFNAEFQKLSEDDFVEFWCIYLISLANEQFIKSSRYRAELFPHQAEVTKFRDACVAAKIPDFQGKRGLRQILGWALAVLKGIRPSVRYSIPNEGGELTFAFFDNSKTSERQSSNKPDEQSPVPHYLPEIREALEVILRKTNLSLWLMVDKLDELFPRRSKVETLALRALLRVLRVFSSDRIRLKIFLRDDMLEDIVADGEGFTALTHVTARQADTLRWSEEQIVDVIVKRIFSHIRIATYFEVNPQKFEADRDYRISCFYRIFPATVNKGTRQSKTLRWIHSRTCDGKGVVTPRDVIDLLMKARQKQQDIFSANPDGVSEHLFEPAALRYGLTELSKRKRITYLEAEFPHLWIHIKKLIGGKTNHTDVSLEKALGPKWAAIAEDLVSIGVLKKSIDKSGKTYTIPYLYIAGLELIRGTDEGE